MLATIAYALIGFIETLVGLRFVLRIIGASPASGFVAWIYDWSTPFVSPFAGIFGQQATVTGNGVAAQSVFDWTALIAILFYAVIGSALGFFLTRFTPVHHY
jgi:YggT family protein